MTDRGTAVAPVALVALVALVAVAACTAEAPRSHGAAGAAPALEARVRFEQTGPGALAPLVRRFAAHAREEGRTPLVYVGATWCEPCRYFHAAAEHGELDDELPPLSLLELDRDRDAERIGAAGYASRMIPLFAVPGPDGTASDRRIEGSVHGPGSPHEIAPRLCALLGLHP